MKSVEARKIKEVNIAIQYAVNELILIGDLSSSLTKKVVVKRIEDVATNITALLEDSDELIEKATTDGT